MWALIAPYLIKAGISLGLSLLEKLGVITGFDAALVKTGTHVLQAVENVKTYSAPSDFPGEVKAGGV